MNKILFILLLFVSVLSFGQRPESVELMDLNKAGKYDEVISKALEYLKDEPRYITFHMMLGVAYVNIAEYKKAIPHLEFTVENDSLNSWKKANAFQYLGICNFMLQNYEKSKDNIDQCLKLNARETINDYASYLNRMFGYDNFYDNWKIIETDHFRFHFQKMKDSESKLYVSSREEAFKFIASYFNSTMPRKIDFFVWNSKGDAKKVLKSNLGFSKPNYCIVHTHYEQTKGHEMTHVISNYSAKIVTKTGLINEGTAVYFDMLKRDDEQLVAQWIKKTYEKIEIKKIWTKWEDYPQELTYPLSGLFVGKLIDTFGKEKFLEFFVDQSYDNAKKVFGDSIDTVIDDFEKKYNVYDN